MLLISVLEHHLLGIKLTTCKGLFIYKTAVTHFKTIKHLMILLLSPDRCSLS
jgi:hypothetical protein